MINKRCAIYTRKSTEEGLEQKFNTLDAQREACLFYISSQKGDGWSALEDLYDDGGYSGGNMERPALQRLIKDIKAGKIDTVVVYKIDRLTRSLFDFSKLVEIFDAYKVTFVSITQSFNTTTSMGRLTLNVLLSFAQFEREVISERVRDKVAASKKKGMWMGGHNPIGYHRVNKELVPKEDEVDFVNMIFNRYLKLGSVRGLVLELRDKGLTSRRWVSTKGIEHGGHTYNRGAIYAILNNPVYIGKIRHKNNVYDGLHEPIVSKDLWDKVQKKLESNKHEAKSPTKLGYLLQGKMYDEEGTIYSPSYTSKNGKKYAYYISRNLVHSRDHPDNIIARLPAHQIENVIRGAFRERLNSFDSAAEILKLDPAGDAYNLQRIKDRVDELDTDVIIRSACKKIVLSQYTIRIEIDAQGLRKQICQQTGLSLESLTEDAISHITYDYLLSTSKRGAVMIDAPSAFLAKDDPFNMHDYKVKNWVKGTAWRDMHFQGKTYAQIAKSEGVGLSYVSRLIDHSFDLR